MEKRFSIGMFALTLANGRRGDGLPAPWATRGNSCWNCAAGGFVMESRTTAMRWAASLLACLSDPDSGYSGWSGF